MLKLGVMNLKLGPVTEQPDTVEELTGLQCLPRPLLRELHCRQFPQLVIDQREEHFRRLGIAMLNLGQNAGNVGHRS